MQNAELNYDCTLNTIYTNINSSRTNVYSICTISNTFGVENVNNTLDETRIITRDINIQIYRYKFTDVFMQELYIFSKVHQYDHRKVFKEAWEVWIEENDNIVTSEVKRLTELGYDGNIIEKMFKSARYYFRKKSTEKKETSERRIYIGVEKNLLESMDKHIISGIIQENYKPSDGFDDFCKNHIDLLKDQVHLLCKNGLVNAEEIKKKMKKTYKNRYFLFVQKI